MAKDYYQTLGVNKTASQEDIKKAFRKLAHEHHPDKGNGNADKFKEINEAYQTLGNEQKRRQYDQFGQSFGQNGGPGGFSYQDFARAQGGNPFGGGFSQGGVHFDFGGVDDLGDLFGSFFGGQSAGRGQAAARGRDIEITLSVDFEEAVFGVEKTFDLSKKVLCSRCGATGAEPGSKINTCKTCGGSGRVTRTQQTILGAFQTASVCPDCRGEGKTYEKKCSDCQGAGVVDGSETIKVKIPAGIADGQSLKLSGQGEASGRGGFGDLYVEIRVKPSQHFERRGQDIFSSIKLSIRQAVLGDKIEVETVDGPVSLKIPPGTQSHTTFRLRDKGVPSLHGRGRGDHIVEALVEIPRSLSRRQKKLLEELDI